MARISVKRAENRYCVKIAGRLSARDLRRLERACGPALERHVAPLDLDVSRMTAADASSETFIRRLLERGAQVLGGRRRSGSLAAAHIRNGRRS